MSMYNGYSNYETWCVNLWIDNEEITQEHYIERAKALREDAHAERYLADEIENEVKDNMPATQGMYGDLLTSAIDKVNWREIAANILEDLPEVEIEEEDEE